MIALLAALVAGAHPLSPTVLRLDQSASGVEVVWRTPRARPVGLQMTPVLPCPPREPGGVTVEADAVQTQWSLDCTNLAGREVAVEGLVPGAPNVLVEWHSPAGLQTVVLHADRTRWTVPADPDPTWTLLETLRLGVWHLWGGLDHILFLCGLMLAVPQRRLVGAVTAFTVGHGISLGLAGSGLLTLPPVLVEVAIALTLVWLAAELLRPEGSPLAEAPGRLCLGIGLIHGLGFAGAWLDLGLSPGSLFGALLGFNLGIELGQLGLIAVVWAAIQWLGRPGQRARSVLAWLGGSVAAMWVWERAALLLG